MDAVEKKIVSLIDKNREFILDFAEDIYNHAELGYKEFRTSEKFKEVMRKYFDEIQDNLAITGVKAYLNQEKKDNFSLALLGELDALRIPDHAHVNPETQAAHCCGHHAQLAGVIGAALALSDKEIADKLDGQVIFFAVPAEEYGEVEFKNTLIEQGKIQYGGGKCELLRIGAFDDIDACLAHHISTDGIDLGCGSNNGFVSKVIRIKGKAAHAAARPDKGVNALSAASLGLQALALNRETFRDEDSVRVHPILTKGGNLVNVVPDEAVIETLVRGKTLEAFADAAEKTDRSFKAGAYALGAGYADDKFLLAAVVQRDHHVGTQPLNGFPSGVGHVLTDLAIAPGILPIRVYLLRRLCFCHCPGPPSFYSFQSLRSRTNNSHSSYRKPAHPGS